VAAARLTRVEQPRKRSHWSDAGPQGNALARAQAVVILRIGMGMDDCGWWPADYPRRRVVHQVRATRSRVHGGYLGQHFGDRSHCHRSGRFRSANSRTFLRGESLLPHGMRISNSSQINDALDEIQLLRGIGDLSSMMKLKLGLDATASAAPRSH
jgi:hypothetical protein